MSDIASDKYLEIKKCLDFRPMPIANVMLVILDIGLIVGASFLVRQESFGLYALGELCIAILMFHCFGILHECGHGSFARQSWINVLFGHLASLIAFLPYYPWKYIHAEHHQWTGNMERDPTLLALKKRKQVGKFSWFHRIVWKSWIPLGGLIQYTVFWGYPLILLRDPSTPRKKAIACLFSVGLLLIFWITLICTWPQYFNLVTLGPAIIIYFVLVELINFPHHSDRPVFKDGSSGERLKFWQQHLTTRSCYYPKLVSELLFLNFNFHVEHHFFPSLPWHRLRNVRQLLKDELQDGYAECVGFEWNVENRSKNPEDVFLVDRFLDEPKS